MKTIYAIRTLGACSAALALAACTTNQLNVMPPVNTQFANGKLVMSVGTVNFNGGSGINVLATYRSPSGYTALPVNSATISGPAGFIGPPGGVGGTADPGAGLTTIPFGAAGNSFTLTNGATTNLAGVDGFGVGPPLSSLPAGNPPNAFPLQPQFGDNLANSGTFGPQSAIYGYPPAYPAQQPQAPPGYPEGFYLLASGTPPTGTYTVNDSATQNGVPVNATATATLASNALLAIMPSPAWVSDGAGGGTISLTVPAGVSETIVNAVDGTGIGASVVFQGAGAKSATIASGTFSFTPGPGTPLVLQAFGFDYDEISLGPPNNISQVPPLPAQADVTVSAPTTTIVSRVRKPLRLRIHRIH